MQPQGLDGPIDANDDEEGQKNTKLTSQSDDSHVRKDYLGKGTREDPFLVDWDSEDPENPFNWSKGRKWLITLQVCTFDKPFRQNMRLILVRVARLGHMDSVIL